MINYEEILKKMVKEYQEAVKRDNKLVVPRNRIGLDLATYKEAEEYAFRSGELLSAVLKKHMTDELFEGLAPDEEAIISLLIPMLKENYEKVAVASMQVQTTLNKKAGLGLNALKPDFAQGRAAGFISAFSEYGTFKESEWLLGDPIITNSQSVVEDCLKTNADRHYEMGMKPTIERIAESGCCEWCSGLAGEYKYPGVPDDVFRRHNNCHCEVLYDPKNGRIQNAHTKVWRYK